MAIDCSTKFSTAEVTLVQANFEYAGELPNPFVAKYYRYNLVENETVTYTVRLFPQTPNPINATLQLYSRNGSVYTLIGISYLTEAINTLVYDGSIGEFYFCIQTTQFDTDYIFTVDFTDYPFIPLVDVECYHGSETRADLEVTELPCDYVIAYEHVGGFMPPGLSLRSDGVLIGTPTELDCFAEEEMTPSFTLSEEDGEENNFFAYSTTRDYIITVRAYFVDNPNVYKDRDFTICIKNNWDKDRDGFIEQVPNMERKIFVKELIYEKDLDKLPADVMTWQRDLEPELVKVGTTLDFRENSSVPIEYSDEPDFGLTDIELKELCDQCVILPEYQELISINSQGLCEVCEEPEIAVAQQLITIGTQEFCECPAEEPTFGLVSLPKTLCPCDDEVQAIVEVIVPTLIEAVPEHCIEHIFYDMTNNKACEIIKCPPNNPIYPDSAYNGFALPVLKKLCEPC